LKIVFMGTPQFAVPSLQNLAEAGHQLQLVVTNPDRRRGRGNKVFAPPIKESAEKLGSPLLQIESIKTSGLKERLRELKPDLGVVVAFGHYLPRSIRAAPRLGIINVHASLLPRHRGAAPISQAILDGDEHYGVTIMQVARHMDAGAILGQKSIPADPHHSCASLTETLSHLGASALVEVIRGLEDGTVKAQPQDESLVTTVGKLCKDDGKLDWSKPAAYIERQSRALNPWPMLRCRFANKAVTIEKARWTPKDPKEAPGTVLASSESGLEVATGQGTLIIEQVKPAGKKSMSAAAFARGRQLKAGGLLHNG
jgi:methionyl-tRNA formyltransferase